jgi:hypothetical protein
VFGFGVLGFGVKVGVEGTIVFVGVKVGDNVGVNVHVGVGVSVAGTGV